jgi:hypothetical protein
MKNKFNIGDKVRIVNRAGCWVVDDIDRGPYNAYLLHTIHPECVGGNLYMWYGEESLSLIEDPIRAHKEAKHIPKFNIGDTVRLINDDGLWVVNGIHKRGSDNVIEYNIQCDEQEDGFGKWRTADQLIPVSGRYPWMDKTIPKFNPDVLETLYYDVLTPLCKRVSDGTVPLDNDILYLIGYISTLISDMTEETNN